MITEDPACAVAEASENAADASDAQRGISVRVRDQYTRYPYPTLEAGKFIPLLAAMDYVRYVLWPGKRDLSGVNVLDAGCGTGMSCVAIARHHPEVHVVGIDLSETSLAAARGMARQQGVGENLELRRLPIEEVSSLGRRFDYILASGVIHHLADPVTGLRELASTLTPTGGMGIMLYGTYGRQGVYIMQDLLRRLVGGEDLADQAAFARKLLAGLPQSNPFKPREWADLQWEGDAGLVDLVLHARDRSYTVPQIYDLLAQCGLRLTRFYAPHMYEAADYAPDPHVAARLAALPDPERAAAAELLHGQMRMHMFFATRLQHVPLRVKPQGMVLLVLRPRLSPVFNWEHPVTKRLKGKEHFVVREHGIPGALQRALTFEPWCHRVLRLCDGTRTCAEIIQRPDLQAAVPGKSAEEKFERLGAFLQLLAEQEALLLEP